MTKKIMMELKPTFKKKKSMMSVSDHYHSRLFTHTIFNKTESYTATGCKILHIPQNTVDVTSVSSIVARTALLPHTPTIFSADEIKFKPHSMNI